MREQFPGADDRQRICGYGEPDTDFAIACTADRATVVVEDSLPSAVITQVLRDPPPKRATTRKTEDKVERLAKFFRMPVPEEGLLKTPGAEVQLRVTLSYFAEVQTSRKTSFRGLDLQWDMQGPHENEDSFRARVNLLVREQIGHQGSGKSFPWEIGFNRRKRGTVQSDRWRGPAPMLAGSKLIAVMPRLGWWNKKLDFREKELPFSLIVTVEAEGVYAPIQVALRQEIEITA